MATPAAARLQTIRYEGGSVRAPKANIEYLVGDVTLSWAGLALTGQGGAGRPYGYRRKANAAAGQPVKVIFNNGEDYTFRVTGGIKNFINFLLGRSTLDNVQQIVTQRGSEFGRAPFFEGA
jgi:hypothetical protein